MTSKKQIGFFIIAASFCLLLAKLAVALYYINAGFDIGDEGQASMGYRYASSYFTFPYYQLAAAIFGSAVGDFIVSRILKLVFELLSVLLLSAALYRWIESVLPEKKSFKNFVLIFLAASLSCGSFLFGRIIIYDDFTLFIPALCFFLLSRCRQFGRKRRRP